MIAGRRVFGSDDGPLYSALSCDIPPGGRQYILLGEMIAQSVAGHPVDKPCARSVKPGSDTASNNEAGLVHEGNGRHPIKKAQMSAIKDSGILVIESSP